MAMVDRYGRITDNCIGACEKPYQHLGSIVAGIPDYIH